MPLMKPDEGPEHYRLSPSSMHRIIPCPGSKDAPPSPGGPAAAVGRALHAEAAKLIVQGESYGPTVPYVDYVAACYAENWHIEQKIASPTIVEFGGTIDAVLSGGEKLEVIDLKTGSWQVEATNNAQLQSYLVLAREIFPKASQFKGTIVQLTSPEPVKSATYTAEQLDEHEAKILSASFRNDRVAGPWCRFCTLKSDCAEYINSRS